MDGRRLHLADAFHPGRRTHMSRIPLNRLINARSPGIERATHVGKICIICGGEFITSPGTHPSKVPMFKVAGARYSTRDLCADGARRQSRMRSLALTSAMSVAHVAIARGRARKIVQKPGTGRRRSQSSLLRCAKPVSSHECGLPPCRAPDD
jgi:hypothetical protein